MIFLKSLQPFSIFDFVFAPSFELVYNKANIWGLVRSIEIPFLYDLMEYVFQYSVWQVSHICFIDDPYLNLCGISHYRQQTLFLVNFSWLSLYLFHFLRWAPKRIIFIKSRWTHISQLHLRVNLIWDERSAAETIASCHLTEDHFLCVFVMAFVGSILIELAMKVFNVSHDFIICLLVLLYRVYILCLNRGPFWIAPWH